MSRISLRDDFSPWSFFLPMLFAVTFGILLADIVRHAAGAVFGEAEVAEAPPAPKADAYDEEDDIAALAEDAAVVTVGQSSGGDEVLLPGPVTAVRDGAERACISGTVALRMPNGWEQSLEEGGVLRCRASSP